MSENMSVKAVEDYISEVSRLAKSGITTEHTFRGALALLLDQLAPNLKAFNEPKRTECGAPDYIVQDKTGLAVFYVEAKDLGDDDLGGKKRTGHKEQFDRYKAALDTIIFTDYLDFHLYRHGEFVSSVKIADYDGTGKVSGISSAYDKLVELIKDAASGTPQKIDSSKRLAELMAGKARLLQRNAAKFLTPLTKAYDDAPSHAKPPITPILELLIGMRNVLMPNVGADEFSDIFAQTLTYGMFAARLNDPTPESFTRYEAMGLIPKTNPFLRQFFQYVANNLEEELEWMVDDLADLFRAADVEKIMRGYGRTGADPMIHFYEDFLAEYDAGLRKDRGVWYTPIQVVKFIVGAADWALRTRFNLVDGLADRGKVEIECEEIAPHGKKMTQKVKKSVHRVQLLDPSTGTGTFIAEAIRQIFAKFKGNEGMWPGYVESDLLPRLNGFELLMASYTMAHIKIDFALRETLGARYEGEGTRYENGGFPQLKQRFNVFLTDSLSDWHKELPGGLFASALAPEQKGADEVKRDTPVMVVLGNPPYSGISQNNGEWISKLVDDYKVEPGGKIKLQERKHWLNDDYVKFIRLAEHYVEKNGEGIVAYITPHGFLDNPTFRGMRWHLMQTFDEIWTLNLHGNSKKKEVAPDGGKDECVFNIMQGVAITLFVKCKGSTGLTRLTGLKDETKNLVNPVNPVKNNCRVYYADLWGKKKEKLAALVSIQDDFINAVYIGSDPDFEGKDITNHYFAYPIEYGEKKERNYVFCRAREDKNTNRLYLHEVFLETDVKNKGDAFQTAAASPKKDASHTNASPVKKSQVTFLPRIILQSLFAINPSSVSKKVDENGEPMVDDGILRSPVAPLDDMRLAAVEDMVQSLVEPMKKNGYDSFGDLTRVIAAKDIALFSKVRPYLRDAWNRATGQNVAFTTAENIFRDYEARLAALRPVRSRAIDGRTIDTTGEKTEVNPLGRALVPEDGSMQQIIDKQISASQKAKSAPPPPAPGSSGNEKLQPYYEPEAFGSGIDDNPIAREEIIDKFRELFPDVAIRGRGTRPLSKSKAGHFEPDAGIIRSKNPVSLRTIPHEIGHYIDAAYKSMGLKRPTSVQIDLYRLGKNLYGGLRGLSPQCLCALAR